MKHPIEYAIRRFYFAFPELVKKYQRYKVARLHSSQSEKRAWDWPAIHRRLEEKIPQGADLMLHSSAAGLGESVNPAEVLNHFVEFCRDRGVHLLIPTHPLLKEDGSDVLNYSPKTSPSTVGLLSELARRDARFLRSRFPFSSVAIMGPEAEDYLVGHLEQESALPHGRNSPYARLAERGGYAVCLGVSFEKSLTMIHVAEELLDEEFPLKIPFDSYTVRVGRGEEAKMYQVRRRSERALPNLSMWSIAKDLRESGAVDVGTVSGWRVDVADCRRVVEEMTRRALKDGYPYMYLPERSL